MDDFMFWIIIIGLAIVIGNQTRQRQEKEMKGMTKKKKKKYINDIKKKQKKDNKILLKIFIIFVICIVLFFTWLNYESNRRGEQYLEKDRCYIQCNAEFDNCYERDCDSNLVTYNHEKCTLKIEECGDYLHNCRGDCAL
jgi:hypothetical protein